MTLNLAKVASTYFDKLFANDDKGKVLLLDKHTTPIILMCYTQTQLLQHNVILVEKIENQSSLLRMKQLNCVVYVKPTPDTLNCLANELASPHYGANYRVFFNNTVTKPQLERLAKADEQEVVAQVCELFQDYQIVNDNLFAMNASDGQLLTLEESNELILVLLGLEQCLVIKFAAQLIELRRLALEILYNINLNSNNNLFDEMTLSDRPPVLLLLDRKHDPVTPLLLPWTYQSMIHEYLGISKNVVEVGGSHYTLLANDDKFYRELMYLNYGDLTEKFQRYVEDYKAQTKVTSLDNLKTQLLADLKKLLAKFPEFKKLLGNIVKHLAIIGELDRLIGADNMWEIGELQQLIVCDLDSQALLRLRVTSILEQPSVATALKVKLVLLYAGRFRDAPEVGQMIAKLSQPDFSPQPPTVSQTQLMKRYTQVFPAAAAPPREGPGITNIFTNKKINFNLFFSHQPQRQNDNVYLQYVPKLNDILGQLIARHDDLADEFSTLVPDCLLSRYGKLAAALALEVQNVIIYIRGGVTYEEARLVHELNESNKGLNFIIGGNRVINSSMWLDEMYDLVNLGGSAPEPVDRQAQLRDIL